MLFKSQNVYFIPVFILLFLSFFYLSCGKQDDRLNTYRMTNGIAPRSWYEKRIPRFDGTQPLILNGKAVGVLGMAHNITELKKIEEAALEELAPLINDEDQSGGRLSLNGTRRLNCLRGWRLC